MGKSVRVTSSGASQSCESQGFISHDFMSHNTEVVQTELNGPKANIQNITKAIPDTAADWSESQDLCSGEVQEWANGQKPQLQRTHSSMLWLDNRIRSSSTILTNTEHTFSR